LETVLEEDSRMRINFTLIVFVASLALCAVMCSTALATPEWEVKGSPVTENVTVKTKEVGEFQMEDTKGSFGSPSTIQCTGSGEGTVGPEGKGKITATSITGCIGVRACEPTGVTVTALHLPWNTQLVETESEIRDKISSGGSGAPGWLVECLVAGITVKDECTGETTVEINDTSSGVDLNSDAKSARGSCTLGGANTGVMAGTSLDENPASGTLEVKYILKGDGIQVEPFQWVFGENKTKKFFIVNTNWIFKEEVVSGKLSKAGAAFEVTAGQECYNTKIEYSAKLSCEITVKSKGKTKESELLEILTKSEGTRTGNFEV
jgi:hypothetical protein